MSGKCSNNGSLMLVEIVKNISLQKSTFPIVPITQRLTPDGHPLPNLRVNLQLEQVMKSNQNIEVQSKRFIKYQRVSVSAPNYKNFGIDF